MNEKAAVTPAEILEYKRQALEVCRKGGYYLNPDDSFTDALIEGILKNRKRYGYDNCPCRLAVNDRQKDLDIICPCYYRDDDVSEFGACYCGLYVSKEVFDKKLPIHSIPERRPKTKKGTPEPAVKGASGSLQISHTVWRCNVCGYLCARDTPPDTCPVCKASRDRFQVFLEK
jgi:ferredoxin-thioredoxin reductase catalytic chain